MFIPIIIIVVMAIVGFIIGSPVAGAIWKDNRPIGMQGDIIASIVTTVVVGLFDWYVIPAMGFTQTMAVIGIIFEPALGALAVLWIIRKAKS